MPLSVSARRSIFPAAIVCLILIATLRPFDFNMTTDFTARRLPVIDWALLPSPEHESLFIDAAANILLFFPLGVACFIRLRPDSKVSSTILSSTIFAALLSSSCEFLQVWLPTRHPQLMDVAANTLGAFAGTIVMAAWARLDTLMAPDEVSNGFRWNAATAVLCLLALLLLAHPAFGLEPVRSVKELEAHAKSFIRSTFLEHVTPENGALPLLLLGAFSFSMAEWAMECFPSLRIRFTYWPVFLVASAFAVLLPIPRIFFRSWSPGWDSIFFGFAGIAIGLALHRYGRLPRFRPAA